LVQYYSLYIHKEKNKKVYQKYIAKVISKDAEKVDVTEISSLWLILGSILERFKKWLFIFSRVSR
jgi:hypothetical protein